MKTIEKLLPLALKVVADTIARNGTVPKPFTGYISSFGASVITSGLLPTIAFYSDQGGAKENRPQLLVAIYELLKAQQREQRQSELKAKNLKEYVLDEMKGKERMARQQILNCCIAIKLALRTFKPIQENTQV